MPKLTQKFQDIAELAPGPEFEGAVLRRIELLEMARAKRAKIWSLAGSAFSIWIFAYVLGNFGGSLIQSEFWSIILLMFSDMQTVAAHWQEFGYSIMETFPVVSVIAMLVPAVVLLWSMSQYFVWHNKFKLVN